MDNDNIDKMMSDAGFNKVNPNQPVEQKIEAPIETPTETMDAKAEENVQANDGKVKDQPTFDLESINKAFNKDFKSVDELTNLFNLPDEYNSVKAQLESKDKDISDKDAALKEKYNPMSYFADEQEFKISQILKGDTKLNRNIVSRLVDSDLDKLGDKEVLKLNDLKNTKGIFDEKIVEMSIAEQYGLNVDKDDLSDDELKSYQVKEYRMKKDAEKAREELKELLNIEIPTFDDPTVSKQKKDEADLAAFNENKQKWDTFTKEFVKTFDKLPIEYNTDDNKKEVFNFDIDDQFKQAVLEHLPTLAAKNNKDLSNEKDVKGLVEQIQKDFLWINRGSVVKRAIEDTLSKFTEEEIKKYFNPSKPKSDEAPISLSEEDRFNQAQQEKMKKDFKIK